MKLKGEEIYHTALLGARRSPSLLHVCLLLYIKINRQPAYFCFRRHSPRETTNEHSSLVWRYTSCKLGSFPSRCRTTASAVDVSLPRRWDSLDVMASLSRRRTSSLGDCIYRIKMQIPAVRQMDRPVVLRTLGPRSTSSSFPVNQTSIADCKKY